MAKYLPPDAEHWPDTVERTKSAIGNWLDRYPDEQILFVAHHGLLAALSELLVSARKEGKNGVPYEIRRDGQIWQIDEVE